MENYIVLSFIGEGSFGRVFKAKHKDTDGIVALKVIRKVGLVLLNIVTKHTFTFPNSYKIRIQQ